MAELSYSVGARNVLNRFFGVDKIVYVEGREDIQFWEIVFTITSQLSIKVEEAGGKQNILNRLTEVTSGTASYLVAIDSDFDHFENTPRHPKILRTRGYSFENSIISPSTLHRLICSLSNVSRKSVSPSLCTTWIDQLSPQLSRLVAFDIINHLDKIGVTIVTHNCDRFMKNKKSSEICPAKVGEYLSSVSASIPTDRYNDAMQLATNSGLSFVEMIRGHFLFSLALRFVKNSVREIRGDISISRESFLSSLLLSFEATFRNTHPHFNYYTDIIKLAVK